MRILLYNYFTCSALKLVAKSLISFLSLSKKRALPATSSAFGPKNLPSYSPSRVVKMLFSPATATPLNPFPIISVSFNEILRRRPSKANSPLIFLSSKFAFNSDLPTFFTEAVRLS